MPPKIITLLGEQVQDLKSQLEKSEQRETALIEEKKELRDLRKNEQARTLASPPRKANFLATADRQIAPSRQKSGLPLFFLS